MILKMEDIKSATNKILAAIDTTNTQINTDVLELVAGNKLMCMNVTNGDYYVRIKIPMVEDINFKATINASLFLKLISQMTSDNIEFIINETNLVVKGNGTYKFPLIYDGEKLLEKPEITINNPTSKFTIHSDILNSILVYNGKEMGKLKNSIAADNQLYYIDEQGAVTVTTGACVNNFALSTPIKILLNDRIIKLFKLFKNEEVQFTLGCDAVSDTVMQTKVSFETDTVVLVAKINADDSTIANMNIGMVREIANEVFPYSVTVSKVDLQQTLNRLSLFKTLGGDSYIGLEFNENSVKIFDRHNDNAEEIAYQTKVNGCSYKTILDAQDIKLVIDSCVESYLTISFGNNRTVVFTRGTIINIIPEAH